MKRVDILEEAKQIVMGKREDEYGSPRDSFKVIANLWSAYLGGDAQAQCSTHPY